MENNVLVEMKENFEFIFNYILQINRSPNKLLITKISDLNHLISTHSIDKEKIGTIFNEIIELSKDLEHFSNILYTIEPVIKKIVEWLGENFQHIANLLRSKELGKKYPIFLEKYTNQWKKLYEKESQKLLSQFYPEVISKTEHFGSTAIPGLSAKPVIDLLVEITSFEKAKQRLLPTLKKEGYGYSWRSEIQPGYMSFFKGYDDKGSQKYHLHMAPSNHILWDRLLFRDYLREFPEKAKEYENLKIKLAKLFQYDREAYTNGKSELILKLTEEAKQKYSPP